MSIVYNAKKPLLVKIPSGLWSSPQCIRSDGNHCVETAAAELQYPGTHFEVKDSVITAWDGHKLTRYAHSKLSKTILKDFDKGKEIPEITITFLPLPASGSLAAKRAKYHASKSTPPGAHARTPKAGNRSRGPNSNPSLRHRTSVEARRNSPLK